MAGGITCAVIGVGQLGWIQGLELSLYDLGIRWNPRNYKDERIVLITIGEEDIQTLGQWPISDQTLAKTLTILKEHQVSAIGLDIYRDIPIEPGHDDLTAVFKQSTNILGIEKLVGQSIPAPPTLSPTQIGFSDQVMDDDRRVRRALLSMHLEGRSLSFSLATQLALHYLQTQNIGLEALESDGARVKLGQAIFHRLKRREGGYQKVDSGGFQILLNWNRDAFDQISLQQVLAKDTPTGGWRDRIVLIGVTSEGAKDFFFTPYSYRPFQKPQLTSGVTLHAQIVSLLIGAALGERSLLLPCSWLVAGLWTLTWACPWRHHWRAGGAPFQTGCLDWSSRFGHG